MVNQIISAARYNNIQGRIAALLGSGSGDKGYNETVASSAVIVGTREVEAGDMNNLFADFRDVYVHIYGVLPSTIAIVIVAADINEDLFAAYETLIVVLETNRFTVDADYADLEASGINSTRPQGYLWGGSADPQFLTHEFTVTFSTPNARRGFFNAGGEIRFSAVLNAGTSNPADPNYAKTVNWVAMLSAMGTVRFGYTSTTNGSITSTLGNLDLTTTYQTVFTKTGSATYTDNSYVIKAKLDNDSKIRFQVRFQDDANGIGGADERVNGEMVSSVNQYRATGIYVSNPSPAYQKISDIS